MLPDEIPEGKAKVAVIYELPEKTDDNAGIALARFLKKYQSESIDIEMRIFKENRKNEQVARME